MIFEPPRSSLRSGTLAITSTCGFFAMTAGNRGAPQDRQNGSEQNRAQGHSRSAFETPWWIRGCREITSMYSVHQLPAHPSLPHLPASQGLETEATWHVTADIATDNSSFLPWVVVLEQNRRLSLARHGANVMSIINPLHTKNFSYKDAIETLNLLYIICELKFKKIMHKRNLILTTY